MTKRICLTVHSLCALIGGCAQTSVLIQGDEYEVPILEARLAPPEVTGWSSVVLENKSAEYLCIAERAFDTMKPGIRLIDTTGKEVRRGTFADGTVDLERNFDFLPAYLFLKPHQKRQIGVDLRNFNVAGGEYRYELTAPYYLCGDIVNSTRNVPVFPIEVRGTVQIDPGRWEALRPR